MEPLSLDILTRVDVLYSNLCVLSLEHAVVNKCADWSRTQFILLVQVVQVMQTQSTQHCHDI